MNASANSFPPPISSRRAAFGGQLTTDDGSPAPAAAPSPAARSNHQQQQQQQQRQTPPHQQSKGKGKAKSSSTSSSATQQQQHQPANAHPAAVAAVVAASQAADEVDEADMCFICAEKAVLWALGECGHRTCHTCSIRLRALYKKRECTFCKTECDRVIFTESATLPYSAYPPAAIPFTDTRLGLAFETREQMDSSISLLRFNCPSPTCEDVRSSWPDLKRHVRTSHQTSICDLCSYHKKIFSHEHSLYSQKEMQKHMNEDHTLCEFCRKAFYDADALYKHCREAHEECFLCVQAGIRHQYHLNYNQLEAHFISTHHPCPHPTCLSQKFVVFATELDLQAHAVETHGASLSDQKSRKDARRIETNFTTAYQQVENRRGGGGGGGGRRERERREQEVGAQAAFVRTEEGGRSSGGERVVPGLGGRRAAFGSGLTLEQPPHQQGRNGNASGSASGSGASTPRADPQVQE
ncbi:hypothetical protein BCR35DRAFT_272992 [Leucosporidium creatinivorum]|uniref:RING-type E3 ubiquitin transferase n=1 Tax=Leucosporidium creatinivorum TaxID=106004 RepID=A0A1Y2CBQ1_9BASI|nr:hypothetical protein BCR35DRAFT_272992 [Leucosporidium creatinivorum]